MNKVNICGTDLVIVDGNEINISEGTNKSWKGCIISLFRYLESKAF